jgi:hypothetical protein
MPRLRHLIVFAAALLLVLPAAAAAQTVQIQARPGASVYLVTDDGRVSLGTLNASGELDIPARLVDSDTELEVVIESSADAINIALVERGRVNPVCALDAPTGVSCVRTGTFLRWGRVERLIVSPAGQVTLEGQDRDDDDGPRWGVGLIVDLDLARAYVSDDDRLCRQASQLIGGGFAFTCVTESTTDAYGAAVSVTFLRLIALKAGYLDIGRVDFDLSGTVNGSAVGLTGRLGRTRGPTFGAALRLDVGWPVVPFGEVGVWRWNTDVRADVTVTGLAPASVTRSLNGWNPYVGAGVELWPVRYVGVQAGMKWVRIEEELPDLNGLLDLDDQFRLLFIGVKFGVR